MTRREWLRNSTAASLMAPTGYVLAQQANPSNGGFDGERLPFSRYGSYWAVSKLWSWGGTPEMPAGEWYVRLLEDDVSPNELFRMEFLNQEERALASSRLTPAKLTLALQPESTSSQQSVDFVLSHPSVMQIRGTGCALRLYTIKKEYGYAIRRSSDFWEVMANVDLPRVGLRCLKGSMRVDAPWLDEDHKASCSSVTINLVPDTSGIFECALEYYDAVPNGSLRQIDFDTAVTEAEAEFKLWNSRLPPLTARLKTSQALAAYVLWSSVVAPRGLYSTPVVWCSKSWMNRIWSWDHCFVAIGLAPSFRELSWQQFDLFRSMQDPHSGMLADWFSNVRRSWLSTKPPIHGWTLNHLMRSAPLSQQELQQIYEPLKKWTNFWLTERNLGSDGLPCILNPNESFDNTTANTLFGPVEAPEIAAYLIIQMEMLSVLAQRMGYRQEAEVWLAKSNTMLGTLCRVLWDAEQSKFVARRVPDGKTGLGDCIFSYVPIVLGKRLPARIIESLVRTLSEPGRFVTPYGLATESLKSHRYDGNSYVKGPVWVPPCAFITDGLHAVGEHTLARKIRINFVDACVRSGMSEHFDAKSGEAQGDPGYNWTAAMFLHFAKEEGLLA